MSRTYRRDAVQLDCSCGAPVGWHYGYWYYGEISGNAEKELKSAASKGRPPDRVCHCWTNRQYDFYSKRNYKRDHKPWGKSTGWFKKDAQRRRRSKERAAMAHGDYDNIPKFKKENDWNWS